MFERKIMSQVKCYAALSGGSELEPFVITRRSCSSSDVVVDIKFAGICHSDIHSVKEEWGKGNFPMVPGHEIGQNNSCFMIIYIYYS